MSRHFALFVLFLSGCAASPSPPPSTRAVIEIDNWWSNDYAKNACWQFAQGTTYIQGLGPQKRMCIDSPETMVATVENQFLTAFQANPDCNGIVMKTHVMDTNYDWSLMFNIAISEKTFGLDAPNSTWSIIDNATHKRYAEGDMKDPSAATSAVCRMVRGRGGSVQ